jgi:hypothetical protein
MVQTRRKGNTNRRKAINILEENGWQVDVVEKVGKWIKQKDMFSLFDLCCIKRFSDELRPFSDEKKFQYPVQVAFVQIATNKPHSHKPFIAFSKKYHDPRLLIAQIVFKDRKNPMQIIYINGKVEKEAFHRV